MVHFVAERTFVLTVHVVPGTLKFMVVIFYALRAVFHFRRVIARFAIDSPFHESVGISSGHGAVSIRSICPIGCPTLPCMGVVARGFCPMRGF